MDHSELQGGDAWDAKIQRQIKECALFIPIISAKSQARREGYFRLEWRLADERMRLLAHGTALILPVVADATKQSEALVPPSFLTVQWVRLPGGSVPPALALRVRRLLGLDAETSTPILDVGVEPASVRAFAGSPVRSPRSRFALTAAIALTSLVIGGLAVWSMRPQPPPTEPSPVVRFSFDTPDQSPVLGNPAVSPDGQTLVFGTAAGLFVRRLDADDARLIPGTAEGNLGGSMTISPDGRSIATWLLVNAGSPVRFELRRIQIADGASSVVTTVEGTVGPARWMSDDTIYFAQPSGIWRVPAQGGAPENVLAPETTEAMTPLQLLPDQRSLLIASTSPSGRSLEMATLPEQTRKEIIPDAVFGGISPQGDRLLYTVPRPEGVGVDVYSVGFDLDSMAPRNDAIMILGQVQSGGHSSDWRVLAYAQSSGSPLSYNVVSVDRQGNEEILPVPPLLYVYPRISPDGTQLALNTGTGSFLGDGSRDNAKEIHVWDFASETLVRLTLGEEGGLQPVWSPDGRDIFYNHLDGKISVKPANNARSSESVTDQITEGIQGASPHFLTPDGQSMVFQASEPTPNLGVISLAEGTQPQWLFEDGVTRSGSVLSPDGKWLAFYSLESGRNEVYVRPFPNVSDDLVQISNEGGIKPLWSKDGSELFYLGGLPPSSPFALMSASVRVENGRLRVTARNPVFDQTWTEAQYRNAGSSRNYDLAPDNEHFIVLKQAPTETTEPQSQSSRIHVVLNWDEALRRQVAGE